ncbi:OB-fold domain-containing protein [Actinomadura sp. DC4]|uniref:OB-fold domain-containing protein n=1 Tax=Actinomadura sp. DC4 TaxID=3055069 RepID=UPI0025B269EB|nr:OB-fold domain-containing protein [Actinomadura sp. DC4]MDN3356951.1 OB-fold domain-containing protein [Actinomadura sp. DC4]
MHDRLMTLAAEFTAQGERPGDPCPEPVNPVMIHHWASALGDANPRWEEVVPPAMIQVWSQHGLEDRIPTPASRMMAALQEAGYTGVVATNCEQTYDRYVRVGEHLRPSVRLGEVTGPKRTALGEGYFVTWHQRWYSGDERVAEMLFRVLKFKPGGGKASGGRYPLRPAVGPDSAFFWDGVQAGELRIQRCAECGELRHPPGPMCPRCHATKRDHVTAAGRGVVHSYVVHHHPPVPGLTPPYVVALVELEEGVRMVGGLLGCEPGDAYVGMPVELEFQRMDDELTLPQWRPAGTAPPVPEEAAAEDEPDLRVELTPTFIISTALATRDFMPVHHDPALARAQGSQDIFLNILTTIGLVQQCALLRVPDAHLEGIALRLGVPAYAGETLSLYARRTDPRTLEVRGAVSLGDHVTATVRLKEPV